MQQAFQVLNTRSCVGWWTINLQPLCTYVINLSRHLMMTENQELFFWNLFRDAISVVCRSSNKWNPSYRCRYYRREVSECINRSCTVREPKSDGIHRLEWKRIGRKLYDTLKDLSQPIRPKELHAASNRLGALVRGTGGLTKSKEHTCSRVAHFVTLRCENRTGACFPSPSGAHDVSLA